MLTYDKIIIDEIENVLAKLEKSKNINDKLTYSEIAKNLSETLKNLVDSIVSMEDLTQDYLNEFDEDEYGDNGNGG